MIPAATETFTTRRRGPCGIRTAPSHARAPAGRTPSPAPQDDRRPLRRGELGKIRPLRPFGRVEPESRLLQPARWRGPGSSPGPPAHGRAAPADARKTAPSPGTTGRGKNDAGRRRTPASCRTIAPRFCGSVTPSRRKTLPFPATRRSTFRFRRIRTLRSPRRSAPSRSRPSFPSGLGQIWHGSASSFARCSIPARTFLWDSFAQEDLAGPAASPTRGAPPRMPTGHPEGGAPLFAGSAFLSPRSVPDHGLPSVAGCFPLPHPDRSRASPFGIKTAHRRRDGPRGCRRVRRFRDRPSDDEIIGAPADRIRRRHDRFWSPRRPPHPYAWVTSVTALPTRTRTDSTSFRGTDDPSIPHETARWRGALPPPPCRTENRRPRGPRRPGW